jgi:hypothetical protein
VSPGLPSWPVTLQALALVVSPMLGLQQFFYNKNPYLSVFYFFLKFDGFSKMKR